MSSNAAQVKAWKESKRGTEPPYHGTRHIYNGYGCRCRPCKDAAAAAERKKVRKRNGRAALA